MPLGFEVDRGVRGAGAALLPRVAGAACGAIVSPSAPAKVVPPPPTPIPAPHAGQNFAVSETSEPHCEQNMGAGILPPTALPRDAPRLPGYWLHLHRRAVRQHFRNSVHHFRRVIPKCQHRVRTVRGGVLQKQLVRLAPRSFAQIRQDRNVPAHDRLQRRAQIPNYAARAHDDPSHHAEVSYNPVPRQFHRRRHHRRIDSPLHVLSPLRCERPPCFTDVNACDSTRLHVRCASRPALLCSPCVEILFEILAVLQILIGLYLAAQGVLWLAYAKRRTMVDPGFYAPRTTVICPCRGSEPGLEQNLVALCEFDHQNYEVFFVLASESDSATPTVKRVAAQSRVKATVLFAGRPEGRGEKVNNLIHAVMQLPKDVEALVFV